MQRADDTPIVPSAGPTQRSWYPWLVVGMLWFVCFFNYADRQAIAAVLPVLGEEFEFTKTQQGLIASAFMWVYALSAPMAGGIGDRTSRKMLILGGLYVWSVVTGFTAACSKLWHFVFVRGAEGLGETFYFPASMSLVSDYHSKRTRSRAMSLHQTSVYAGTVGGAWFAGWMTQVTGDWRYPFIVLGVAGVVLGLVLAAFIREPERNEAERRESGEPDTEHPTITPASGGKPRENRSFEYDSLSPVYAEFLQKVILPKVAKNYKLTDKPEERAIGGISSGGICAWTVAWEQPDHFRKVLSHVGSFTHIRGGHVYPALIRKTERKPIRVFLQDGDEDLDNIHGSWPLANQEMAAALKFAGYDHVFEFGHGGHNGKHGGAILPESLCWLWKDVVAARAGK